MTFTDLKKILSAVLPDCTFSVDGVTGEVIVETGSFIDAEDETLVPLIDAELESLSFQNETFDRKVASHCNFDPDCREADCLCPNGFEYSLKDYNRDYLAGVY